MTRPLLAILLLSCGAPSLDTQDCNGNTAPADATCCLRALPDGYCSGQCCDDSICAPSGATCCDDGTGNWVLAGASWACSA